MNDRKQKFMIRVPAVLLLAATLLFWGWYQRYEPAGPVLLQNPSLDDARRVQGDCTEAEGHFSLDVPPGGKPASINFRMAGGAQYGLLRVRGRLKTRDVSVGPNAWRCARLLLIQYDENGHWIPGHHGVIAETGTTDWAIYEDVFEIDDRAVHTDLVIQQTGVSGTAEFDQLIVEPVRLRNSLVVWRIVFAGLWLVAAIFYFRRCRLDRRRLRWLILLNALAIIVGILMPEKWIEDVSDFADTEAVKVVRTVHVQSQQATEGPKKPAKPDAEQAALDRFNEVIGHVHGAGHFILFGSLCFLVYCSAALERQRRSYYFKVAFDVLLFAAVTESLQYLTLDRTPGLLDWLTDAYGMAAAFVLFLMCLGAWRCRPGRTAA